MDTLEYARKVANRLITQADNLSRRLDYARQWRMTFTDDSMRSLVHASVRASRAAKVASRAVAYFESGALFYNARDLR